MPKEIFNESIEDFWKFVKESLEFFFVSLGVFSWSFSERIPGGFFLRIHEAILEESHENFSKEILQFLNEFENYTLEIFKGIPARIYEENLRNFIRISEFVIFLRDCWKNSMNDFLKESAVGFLKKSMKELRKKSMEWFLEEYLDQCPEEY